MTLSQKMRQMRNYMKIGLALGTVSALSFALLIKQATFRIYEGYLADYEVTIEKMVNFEGIRDQTSIYIDAVHNPKMTPYFALGIDYDNDKKLDEITLSTINQYPFRRAGSFKVKPSGEIDYPINNESEKRDYTFSDVYKAKLILEEAIKSIMNKEHLNKITRA